MAHHYNPNKLKSFILEQINPKTILGLALIGLSIIIYIIYENTRAATNTAYLIPLGVVAFGIGFHFSISKIKALQSMKKILTFLVIGILGFAIISMTGWDQYILNSSYAMMLAKVMTNVSVFILNLFNIHATQNGNDIIFPSDSKISAVTVLPICAGIHLSAMFLAAFGLMLVDLGRKASKKKLAILFVLGAISIFFACVGRITFLSYVAYAFGIDALETDHMYAGAIIFLSLIGVFWWLSIRWILKKPQAQINRQI